MVKIVLASASPRRTEILKRFRTDFKVVPSDIPENIGSDFKPEVAAMSIAFQKAYDVAKNHRDSVVIGADTIVFCEKILGKPKDRQEAFEMLKTLSGKEHYVITGISIVELESDIKTIDYDMTRVKFKHLDDETIERYLDREEYVDKAGAYAIQGIGETLVDWISGSHSNVVGLPVGKLQEMLKRFKLELL